MTGSAKPPLSHLCFQYACCLPAPATPGFEKAFSTRFPLALCVAGSCAGQAVARSLVRGRQLFQPAEGAPQPRLLRLASLLLQLLTSRATQHPHSPCSRCRRMHHERPAGAVVQSDPA